VDDLSVNVTSKIWQFYLDFVIQLITKKNVQADKGGFQVDNLGWLIVTRQPKVNAFKSIQVLQRKIVFWGLLLASIFSLIGWYFASYLTQPLLNLAYYPDQIRRGDYEIIKRDRILFANTKKHKYYNNYFKIQLFLCVSL